MFTRLSATEKAYAIIPSCVPAVLALFASLKLANSPTYSEFIVGSITWTADSKLQDLVALPAVIVVFALSLILLLSLLERLKGQYGDSASAKLSKQLVWWSLPAVAATSTLLLGASVDRGLFFISAAGITFVVAAHLLNTRMVVVVGADRLGLTAFAVLLLSLLPLELSLLLSRAPSALVGEPDHSGYATATYLFAVAGLIYCLYLTKKHSDRLFNWLPRLLMFGQIGLSVIFLTLYPATLVLPHGSVAKYSTTFWLRGLVVILVLLAVADTLRRYRARSGVEGDFRALSPFAIFGLLIGLKAGVTVAPVISVDDYHFGETLLGWWSYSEGAIPYVDYVPPHGLIVDDFAQMLSFIFYDGLASSVPEASRLGLALLAFVAFMSLYAFTKHLGLAFVATFFASGWLFLTPFLCLWLSRRLMERPARWLAVWMVTAPIVLLGIPAQGLVLVAASGVAAVAAAWRMYRNPDQRSWGELAAAVLTLGVFAFLTPAVAMLTGAVSYVMDNASINQVAYGVTWVQSLDASGNSWILLEAIRMSWVAIPIVCLIVMYIAVRGRTRRWNVFLPAAVVFLFVLVLVPYSMGRIDPGSVSRAGTIANFGWTALLPIAVWPSLKSSTHAPLMLLMVWMSAALNLVPLSSSDWVDAAAVGVAIPPIAEGEDVGLPNIGHAYIDGTHKDRLVRLGAILDAELDPGEPYLDLTSRNAQYFYLDRKPVLPVTAAYNMVGHSAQESAVEILSRDLPRLALLEGMNILYDGGGLALRTPYLYRFVVDNYSPRYVDGFIIGRSAALEDRDDELPVHVAVQSLTDANWDRGVHRFDPFVLVDDPVLISVVSVGDFVVLGDGEIREVAAVSSEHNALRFLGTPIDPSAAGYPNSLRVFLSPEHRAEYSSALLQRALAVTDFQRIPVAWGRSQDSLAGSMRAGRVVG